MKKRNLAIIYLLILTIGTILSLYIPKQDVVKADTATAVIPDKAIRLRILANSDREADQAVKRLIRDEVNHDITRWVAKLTSLKEARKVIVSHLDEIQATAEKVMAKEGLHQTVKVDFGQAKFPTKLYGQYLYPAGDYEAVIITLGDGEGANWWCVLFPPLCFLDFSNGTAVSKSPYGEEEVDAAGKKMEGTSNQAQVAKPTEVAANQVETTKSTEAPLDQKEAPPNSAEETNTTEDLTTSQQTAAENNQVDNQENKQRNEQTENPTESDSKDQTEQATTDKKEAVSTEAPPETPDQSRKQIYNGTEEPKIVEKSFFAELFSKLF